MGVLGATVAPEDVLPPLPAGICGGGAPLFDPSYFDGDLAIINSMETTEMPTSTAVGSKARAARA